MKDMGRLKLSSIYTAAMLKQELDTEVIPVIAVRDSNRSGVRTLFLTALSYGLDSVMLVWGDRYVEGEGSANVYDYPSLSEAIREMRALADRANISATILAPVNVATLETKKGASIAASRLESGADCLLAQPPTSDVSVTLPRAPSPPRREEPEVERPPQRLPIPGQGGHRRVQGALRLEYPRRGGQARRRRGERRGSSRSPRWSSRRCARTASPGSTSRRGASRSWRASSSTSG